MSSNALARLCPPFALLSFSLGGRKVSLMNIPLIITNNVEEMSDNWRRYVQSTTLAWTPAAQSQYQHWDCHEIKGRARRLIDVFYEPFVHEW